MALKKLTEQQVPSGRLQDGEGKRASGPCGDAEETGLVLPDRVGAKWLLHSSL